MEGALQIAFRFFIICLMFNFFSAQEKWNYSAEEMDQIKVNGQTIRRLKKNVRFVKTGQVIHTDNAIQYIKDDVLYMNGNTRMINGLDTLTCDSMVYWSELDSGYAMGRVHYVQPKNGRRLTTSLLHYWQTEGYRGSSFFTQGYTRVTEPNQLITANKISYDDDKQMMTLTVNASVESSVRGILGDEIIIQYADSLIKEIHVTTNAFAYNDLNVRIEKYRPYRRFRDEMSSREMKAHFTDDAITQIELISMATTLYHVINDSLLAGINVASGDSIYIDFTDGNFNRIQVIGGALGEFKPEGNDKKIDTTIFYGANYLDYHIDAEKTFLSKGAYVEYQNTKLSSGKIIVDWQTNILDAVKVNEEYPTVRTRDEEPMKGNSMVFDLVAKHGLIDQGRTSFNQSFYHGKEVFRDDPNVFHVEKSKYTSCELDHPHFYLGSRKMKMLPGDKVIAKPLFLHIYDIPIMGIPLAVFPNKGGKRHSGWIMPSFDSYRSIGTGFRDFGYYWAPNDYIDAKTVMNFFDKEGIHVRSHLKYKIKHGQRLYNHKLNGHINGTFKRRIISNEIIDLADANRTRESFRLNWYHSQAFDPTQKMGIKYEYISNKDAYQNNQEVSLQNRLKQNLSSSFNYSKNWQTSSISVGYNTFRDLAIENKTPEFSGYLNEGRYKSYKYEDGPKFNFRAGSRKIFGIGDKWYHSFTASYNLKASMGRKDHWLIKQDSTSWIPHDTTKFKHGGIKNSTNLSAPQTFFRWLTINPNISVYEDWIFNYKMKEQDSNGNMVIVEKEGFKSRLTWNASISAKTNIYGLLPITIGRLNSLRHIITPRLSFTFRPDFSNTKYGGNNYFQKMDSGEKFDYFWGSYVGSTSHQEKRTYSLSVSNIFQAKIRDEKEGYNKVTFLTWNSSISYNTLKKLHKLSEMTSNIRVKNLLGNELFRVKMYHNFYRLGKEGEPINEMINILEGELPRLTYIDIITDMKFKLFGSSFEDIKESDVTETAENIDEELYNEKDQKQSNKGKSSNLWRTQLEFSYRTNWKYPDKEWEYSLFLNTTHKINLSRNWSLSYTANFNIKEKEIIRNKFSINRPLHCWEFSFSYWPGNSYSSGFSLQINVKNPDLQDLKLTSKSSRWGFGE